MSKIKPLTERYEGPLKKFVTRKLYLYTHMSLTDNTHLEIENVKNIIEYNDIYIKLKTSNMTVAIWGKNLSVNDYGADGIVINGEFSSIEFEK
ncbi:MAG: YabP/YqfC family sporulation protein [Ruminococcus sp.]|jgi:sporulation protein YqfC|nr:YabP/YqfC family sporulation protein [Ruminococcus sp.]